MNRRNFTKTVAIIAGASALPSWATTSAQADSGGSESRGIIRLRIGLLGTAEQREKYGKDLLAKENNFPALPPDDDDNYWAEAIETDGQCYYRAKGVTIQVSEAELQAVISNPSLYYFSTALKLHHRINAALAAIHGVEGA